MHEGCLEVAASDSSHGCRSIPCFIFKFFSSTVTLNSFAHVHSFFLPRAEPSFQALEKIKLGVETAGQTQVYKCRGHVVH